MARGEIVAIATNKRLAPSRLILARYFPGVFPSVCGIDGVHPDDGTIPGDKPTMLRWLASRYPGEPTVMVGDTIGDIDAARAVGGRANRRDLGLRRRHAPRGRGRCPRA